MSSTALEQVLFPTTCSIKICTCPRKFTKIFKSRFQQKALHLSPPFAHFLLLSILAEKGKTWGVLVYSSRECARLVTRGWNSSRAYRVKFTEFTERVEQQLSEKVNKLCTQIIFLNAFFTAGSFFFISRFYFISLVKHVSAKSQDSSNYYFKIQFFNIQK